MTNRVNKTLRLTIIPVRFIATVAFRQTKRFGGCLVCYATNFKIPCIVRTIFHYYGIFISPLQGCVFYLPMVL